MTPKTHTWPSGHTRELPGSLPGPSRWRKRPGRIMVMVTYIAPACSSACTTGAHLCICRPIGGHLSSSSAPRLSPAAPAAAPAARSVRPRKLAAEAGVRCYRASLAAPGALLRRYPLSRGPLIARVGPGLFMLFSSGHSINSFVGTQQGVAGLTPRLFTLEEETGSHHAVYITCA